MNFLDFGNVEFTSESKIETKGFYIPANFGGGLMKKGVDGEEIIYAWLKTHPQVTDVEDVRDIVKYRAENIDFIAHLKNGETWNIEVKNDKNFTCEGNVFFETRRKYFFSDGIQYKTGWGYKCKADYIYFYSKKDNAIYSIKPYDLIAALAWYESVYSEQYEHTLKSCDDFHTMYKLMKYKVIEKFFTRYELN